MALSKKESDSELIQIMLDYQDKLNTELKGKDWRSQNFQWHRAIWIECAELMDCFPWKWWAKVETDLDNALIEAVDVWHFILSWSLQKDYPLAVTLGIIERAKTTTKGELSIEKITEGIELLAKYALDKDVTGTIYTFYSLLSNFSCGIKTLARVYFGKNILNYFRKLKGIQEGTYDGYWNGVEDNKVMLRLIKEVKVDVREVEKFREELTNLLEKEYQKRRGSSS